MGLEESLFAGDQAYYLEAMYNRYLQNPSTVDPTWRQFFSDTMHGDKSYIFKGFTKKSKFKHHALSSSAANLEVLKKSINLQMLIRVFRVRGHLNAQLDPLKLNPLEQHAELNYHNYGFSEQDLDTEIFLNGNLGFESATLQQVLDKLDAIYCRSIGYEFMHIQDAEQKQWLQMQIENTQINFSNLDKIALLKLLIAAEDFEKFLAKKYPGAKRFGLEGAESTIPALEMMVQLVAADGGIDIVFGMAHRGRLNVLGNILNKPMRQIFSAFQGTLKMENNGVQGSGDVKYHLGASMDRTIAGHTVHLSLTANPSHLESVNPVVMGKVRAKQQVAHDDARTKIIGILIHGDAAFAGQGIVAEVLMLSKLPGYKSGGTLHLIINNQIGFTTSPHLSRSSPYCSDIAKSIQAPIFHVNADDPEAVIHVTKIAAQYREKFKSDVVIDLICYRRHGHNEIDEPAFTQPLMYEAIRNHATTRDLYVQQLITEKVITDQQAQNYTDDYNTKLSSEFDRATKVVLQENDWLQGKWDHIKKNISSTKTIVTKITGKNYSTIAQKLFKIPKSFNLHPRLARIFQEKQHSLNQGINIDWATGEALAFGSLLLEGYPVRLSGQDVGRGTFSQRHAILHDQKTSVLYAPLNQLSTKQASIEVVDSPLSEAAVLGFDLGYSMSDPHSLVVWEAQFGDFSNGAQVIIDQFISSGESKWLRLTGLVMLLPHGYEGQGPEHSSSRLERYLQLCAQDNMQVVNCTTPANYFHVLRRQMHMATRKPLIVITPKSLLRHKLAVSTQADFTYVPSFQPVFDDARSNKNNVKRVIVCSGKVYYDLLEVCIDQKIDHIALVRLEQYYPFPHDALVHILKQYNQAEVIWCQEEPENMGAWTFLDRRLEKVMIEAKTKAVRPVYVGRQAAASPATGSSQIHQQEQHQLINTALMRQR